MPLFCMGTLLIACFSLIKLGSALSLWKCSVSSPLNREFTERSDRDSQSQYYYYCRFKPSSKTLIHESSNRPSVTIMPLKQATEMYAILTKQLRSSTRACWGHACYLAGRLWWCCTRGGQTECVDTSLALRSSLSPLPGFATETEHSHCFSLWMSTVHTGHVHYFHTPFERQQCIQTTCIIFITLT